MKPTFLRDELVMPYMTEKAQRESRRIFEILKEKAKAGEYLTEYEKNYFCQFVKISLLNDGVLENYPCCDNFKFKLIFLTYAQDITGGTPIAKPTGVVNNPYYFASPTEAQVDLEYLYNAAKEWEATVSCFKHRSKLLQEVSIAARYELKKLKNLPEFKDISTSTGGNIFLFAKRKILLKSRYMYCLALEVFEDLPKEAFISHLNDHTINIEEYSLIHIINRHFAKSLNPANTEKSFHNENFDPRKLCIQIRNIINEIDNSKVLSDYNFGNKLLFSYKENYYIIWFSDKERLLPKNQKMVYKRIETFYPVEDENEIMRLLNGSKRIKISSLLDVYIT